MGESGKQINNMSRHIYARTAALTVTIIAAAIVLSACTAPRAWNMNKVQTVHQKTQSSELNGAGMSIGDAATSLLESDHAAFSKSTAAADDEVAAYCETMRSDAESDIESRETMLVVVQNMDLKESEYFRVFLPRYEVPFILADMHLFCYLLMAVIYERIQRPCPEVYQDRASVKTL